MLSEKTDWKFEKLIRMYEDYKYVVEIAHLH